MIYFVSKIRFLVEGMEIEKFLLITKRKTITSDSQYTILSHRKAGGSYHYLVYTDL